ncbi:putative disease resistance protein RGA1 [Dichanthelium oligosanthes]|uniref:non-specific serine/threonine protein kinase n=1 Tax=Dichanthelium oligosanthes TaxID=888268 RepID=A0A1E5UP82_9POAL|nr:putative disease resistance protein RGA1 [Dichanthelium oligosanthes]
MELEDVSFQFLREITDGFSDERKLGEGAFGVVYKILGYCYETEKNPSIMPNGKKVFVEETHTALCFEYLCNGSLQKHLSDNKLHEPKLDWHKRFKIIKGTCEGLKYIHKDLGKQMYHLDLKPDNILLDKDMLPKIADFEDTSHQSTSKDEFVDQVKKRWRNELLVTCSSDLLLEACCHQVERCTHIALECVNKDKQKRPDIVKIIEELNKIETDICKHPQKEIREPKDIVDKHLTIRSHTDLGCSDQEVVDVRETSSDVLEEIIVGRTQEKEEIMTSLLEGMSKKITILPIYGIGGIGKTTFARLIYNDLKFNGYSRVWVYVSQRFDLDKVCKSIISQLSEEESHVNERQMISSCLKKLLSRKKIMIVLDDTWEDNPFQLQELKDMIYHDDSNIIILVTTRSELVAERICTNIEPYKILPLSEEMCWDIIKQRCGFEDRVDKEQLMDIGKKIAQKCAGVALAAQSLGFTLRSMNLNQWMKVNDSNIWSEPVSNHVHASLKLSYSYMSDECLKKCFAYCAIFPKGHKIVKDDLIYQWISLDFIKPKKLLSIMEICEKYIVQLLGLSFFQQLVLAKVCYFSITILLLTFFPTFHSINRNKNFILKHFIQSNFW